MKTKILNYLIDLDNVARVHVKEVLSDLNDKELEQVWLGLSGFRDRPDEFREFLDSLADCEIDQIKNKLLSEM